MSLLYKEKDILEQINNNIETFYTELRNLYRLPDDKFIKTISKYIYNTGEVDKQGFCRTTYVAYCKMVKKLNLPNLVELNKNYAIDNRLFNSYDIYLLGFYGVFWNLELINYRTKKDPYLFNNRNTPFLFNTKQERLEAINKLLENTNYLKNNRK